MQGVSAKSKYIEHMCTCILLTGNFRVVTEYSHIRSDLFIKSSRNSLHVSWQAEYPLLPALYHFSNPLTV